MRIRVFGHMRTANAEISACAQSDLGISCPLIESLATVEHNVVWQCSDMDIYRLPLPRRHLFSCRGSYISNPVVI